MIICHCALSCTRRNQPASGIFLQNSDFIIGYRISHCNWHLHSFSYLDGVCCMYRLYLEPDSSIIDIGVGSACVILQLPELLVLNSLFEMSSGLQASREAVDSLLFSARSTLPFWLQFLFPPWKTLSLTRLKFGGMLTFLMLHPAPETK